MRIALVVPTPGPRTGARIYAGMIEELLSSRHDVVLVAASAGEIPDAEIVHVLDAKSFLSPRAATGGRALVVDLHDAYWNGKPTYPAFDRLARTWARKRRRPRYQALLHRADQVVVHAETLRGSVPHRRCTLVPIPAVLPPSRDRLPPGPHPRVLFAGRDSLRKGLPVLAQAVRLLARTGATVELRVAGGDWIHLRAARRWWLRGLAARFEGDLGPDRMDEALRWADLVAVPSYTEAFGLVAQEALLRATPVVASRVGGLEEILTEAGGGILVPPADAAALAAALRTVLDDRAGWSRRAEAAGAALAAHRTPERALAALEKTYAAARIHARERRKA